MEESVNPELAQVPEPSQDPVDTSSQGTHGPLHHMHLCTREPWDLLQSGFQTEKLLKQDVITEIYESCNLFWACTQKY